MKNITKFELSNTKGAYYVSDLRNEMFVYNNIDENIFNIQGYEEGVSVDFTQMTHDEIVEYLENNYSVEIEDMEGKDIIELIQNIANDTKSELEKTVAEYLLDYTDSREDLESHIGDILHHGCVSGCVSDMTYFADTYKFFDEHYDEIQELAQEEKRMTGFDILSQIAEREQDLKNYMSWFAWETTVRNIADKIELNV
ncbi:hypothetical protein [Bacillus phage vB_BanS-Thrax1]|nr:hypothetical protein [Bacillus phage vB_BanS-Thrax1]